MLLAPLHTLAKRSTPPTASEYQVTTAIFRSDFDKWSNRVSQFVVVGGVRFEQLYNQIVHGPNRLYWDLEQLGSNSNDPSFRQAQLRDLLTTHKAATAKRHFSATC